MNMINNCTLIESQIKSTILPTNYSLVSPSSWWWPSRGRPPGSRAAPAGTPGTAHRTVRMCLRWRTPWRMLILCGVINSSGFWPCQRRCTSHSGWPGWWCECQNRTREASASALAMVLCWDWRRSGSSHSCSWHHHTCNHKTRVESILAVTVLLPLALMPALQALTIAWRHSCTINIKYGHNYDMINTMDNDHGMLMVTIQSVVNSNSKSSTPIRWRDRGAHPHRLMLLSCIGM